MYKHVLFDLDGTLTDSKEGIIKSVLYGLDKLGIEEKRAPEELDSLVGPPLMTTFLDTYGFSQAQAEQAYAYFQERYSTIGRFENRPFPGILPMLKMLHESGVKTYLATSKPTVHAEAIAHKFGLAPYLTMISGSQLGGTEDKAFIISKVLQHIGTYEEGDVVMVGDRKYDVIGARKAGVPVILVGFGYGSEEERQEYPPDGVAPTVENLQSLLLA